MLHRHYGGNLTQSIVQKLGQAIVSGDIPIRQPLKSEADLCTDFGASRTILREAVKMLTAKGMLDARPRRGTIVLPESHWNLSDPDILSWLLNRSTNIFAVISEFVDMRLAIEPMAASLAARYGKELDVKRIKQAVKKMRNVLDREDELLEADIMFHLGVLQSSSNRFFWNMRHTVEVALRASIRITNQYHEFSEKNIEQHEQILNYILESKPDAAEEAMKKMILETKVILKNVMDSTTEK